MTIQSTRTYSPVLAPALPRWADIALVLGASAFVALMAQAAIPLPFSPVPITGQTFAVLLVGAALGSRRGALAMSAYLAEGLAGLPVFAGGMAGPAVLIGPRGGYLIGFIAMAWLVGWLSERGLDRRVDTALIAFVLGEAVLYLCGLAVLAIYVGAENAPAMGLFIFLPGDAIKIAAAALTLPAAWRIVGAAKH
ncbi:MAG: biotin transporter BioY [Anaerolineae bacterium]|nr:biotin transporter BioY [Anaerolineae bacterium]